MTKLNEVLLISELADRWKCTPKEISILLEKSLVPYNKTNRTIPVYVAEAYEWSLDVEGTSLKDRVLDFIRLQ